MSKAWVIAKRDFHSFFSSPVAYIVLAVYALLSGLFFFRIIDFFAMRESARIPYNAEIGALVNNMAIIFLFVSPMVSMRSFAEERKLGTYDLLVTAPITIGEMVWGKFLGTFLLFGVMIVVAIQYPAFLMSFGNPDLGPILTGFLGFTLFGATCLAIGVFASSLTENQIAATMVSFGLLLTLWVIGMFAEGLAGGGAQLVTSLSLTVHLENFVKGVLDLGDVLYYVSVTALFLFSTVRRLEAQRW